ncbi:uncharacterized protein LOC141774397 [Sebastes fasciatus]|uniref:uncharacterized protein LOC141774397 n=1 Tax=Sebastes fasciatus TaxID=394691 RepID=UPI003D9E6CEA
MRRTLESRDKSNKAEMEESRCPNVSEVPQLDPKGLHGQSKPKTHAEYLAQKDRNELLEKIDELQHRTQAMRVMIKNLTAEVQDREKRGDNLKEQNKTIREELAQFESHILQKQAEIKNLLEELQEAQEKGKITADENQRLIGKVAHLENLREGEVGRQAAMSDLQELISVKDEEIQNLTYAGEKLKRSQHELQKREVSLTEQNRTSSNELARLESLAAKLNEEKRNLQTAERDLRIQAEVDNEQIYKMEEHITNQTRQIAYNQEQLNDYHILTTDLKQKVADLTDQLEAKTEEEILAGVEQPRDEILFETTLDDQSDDTCDAATTGDQSDGIFYDNTSDDQSYDSVWETTSEDQSDECLPEKPASVFWTKSFWWNTAKVVGVSLAMVVVGIGAYNAYF